MILSFYVKGKAEGATANSDLSYLEAADQWIQEKYAILPDLKWEDAVDWSKERAQEMWDKSIRAFKYISGSPLPPPSMTTSVAEQREDQVPEKKGRSAWDFVGVFSSLRSTASKASGSGKEDRRVFTEGDVHADLVKVRPPYFACLCSADSFNNVE